MYYVLRRDGETVVRASPAAVFIQSFHYCFVTHRFLKAFFCFVLPVLCAGLFVDSFLTGFEDLVRLLGPRKYSKFNEYSQESPLKKQN